MARPITALRSGWGGATRLSAPFRTLVAGQALGQLGDGLTQISFAQLVVFDVGRGATPGRIAAIFAATLLPFSIVGPLAGVWIDRWDRRRTLVVSSLCRAALTTVALAAVVWRSVPLAYVGVVLLLSFSRFVLDAKGAVLPRTVAKADLVQANAISALVGMTAAFAGAVGGALFVSWSDLAGFTSGAGAYLAAGACFLRLPGVGGGTTGVGVGAALRRVSRELRDGAAAIVRTPQLRRPLLAVWLHRLLLGAGFVLLVLVADRQYHLETSGYALALAVAGVAAVLGTVGAPWLAHRWRATALLPLAFLPPAAVAIAVGYGPTLPGLIGIVAVCAVAFQVLKIIADALVGGNSPDVVRGRVFAIYDVVYNVSFVLAGLALIPLWQLARERALLWWLGAGFAAGWLLTARFSRVWPFASPLRTRPAVPHRWWLRAAAPAAGAVVVVVFPAPALWWAAWFALVPWLILIRRAPSAREATIRGFLAALGFLTAVHYWLLPSTTVFLPLAAAVLASLWLPWSALTWRLLQGRMSGGGMAASVTVIPAGWVLIETVRSWSALGGPWGLLGASQWVSPTFLAPASAGGVWLVSYLIVAANVAIAVTVGAGRWRSRSAAAMTVTALLAVGPVWSAVQPATRGTARFRVAVVEAGVVPDAGQRLAAEIAATQRLTPRRYDLVVWGESSVGFDLRANPALQRRLEAVAGRLRSELLVNVDARAPDGAIHKTAVLLDRRGILASYEKIRLVPFGEYIPMRPLLGWLASVTKAAAINRARGDQIVIMHAGGLRFAPLICFESAFPDMSRAAARRGAQLLVFQTATTTFQGSWAPEQQASLAAVRAVETGRPAVQASLAGTSAAFDAQGRRLAWFTDASGTVGTALPVETVDTPFDRYGNWVPAGCVLLLGGALIALALDAARRAGEMRKVAIPRSSPVSGPARPR